MKNRLARKKSLKTKLMQKESVSKQGRKPAKSEPAVHKDPAFDDLDDAMDYMETKDTHDEGTVKGSEETKKVLEEKAKSDAKSEGVNEVERKFAQLANDEEIARKVQEEWEAEEEKKRLAEEEATKDAFTNEYDFIQARLNADKILVEKLQEEKREKFTIKQRAKFLHDAMYVGGYRHAQLNKKKFEEIQVMYEKVKRANENFIPIGSDKEGSVETTV
ncbi:hypothetical protein Tco_1489977 [Tanacetum coccineum]